MTIFNDGLYQYGGAPVGSPIFSGGAHYFVDRDNGSDSNTGKGWNKAKKTLASAYASCTANKHDVVYLIGSTEGSHAIASKLTWAKDQTHLVAVAAPGRTGGRARMVASANFTPMIDVTASGCYFKGIHIQHGRGTATNLIGLQITGDRNVFEDCQIESPINATEAAAANYKGVNLASGAQDTAFRRCSFGSWTVQASSTTGSQVYLANDNGSTWFDDCVFQAYASTTSHCFVRNAGNLGGEASMVGFHNCKFYQLDESVTLTKAMVAPTTGVIMVSNCTGFGFTDWADTGTNNVYVSGAAVDEGSGIGTAPA